LKKNISLILLVFFVACQQQQGLKDQGPAKDFSLYDTDSLLYHLADYRGKIVMIHFWADWCPHCRGEFPKIQQAYDQLQGQNFEILAVNAGQSADHVRDIRQTYHLTYPLLLDSEAKTAEAYSVAGLPSTYFVDTQGHIVKVFVGWLEQADILNSVALIQNQP
jgi:peroxiredoxin